MSRRYRDDEDEDEVLGEMIASEREYRRQLCDDLMRQLDHLPKNLKVSKISDAQAYSNFGDPVPKSTEELHAQMVGLLIPHVELQWIFERFCFKSYRKYRQHFESQWYDKGKHNALTNTTALIDKNSGAVVHPLDTERMTLWYWCWAMWLLYRGEVGAYSIIPSLYPPLDFVRDEKLIEFIKRNFYINASASGYIYEIVKHTKMGVPLFDAQDAQAYQHCVSFCLGEYTSGLGLFNLTYESGLYSKEDIKQKRLEFLKLNHPHLWQYAIDNLNKKEEKMLSIENAYTMSNVYPPHPPQGTYIEDAPKLPMWPEQVYDPKKGFYPSINIIPREGLVLSNNKILELASGKTGFLLFPWQKMVYPWLYNIAPLPPLDIPKWKESWVPQLVPWNFTRLQTETISAALSDLFSDLKLDKIKNNKVVYIQNSFIIDGKLEIDKKVITPQEWEMIEVEKGRPTIEQRYQYLWEQAWLMMHHYAIIYRALPKSEMDLKLRPNSIMMENLVDSKDTDDSNDRNYIETLNWYRTNGQMPIFPNQIDLTNPPKNPNQSQMFPTQAPMKIIDSPQPLSDTHKMMIQPPHPTHNQQYSQMPPQNMQHNQMQQPMHNQQYPQMPQPIMHNQQHPQMPQPIMHNQQYPQMPPQNMHNQQHPQMPPQNMQHNQMQQPMQNQMPMQQMPPQMMQQPMQQPVPHVPRWAMPQQQQPQPQQPMQQPMQQMPPQMMQMPNNQFAAPMGFNGMPMQQPMQQMPPQMMQMPNNQFAAPMGFNGMPMQQPMQQMPPQMMQNQQTHRAGIEQALMTPDLIPMMPQQQPMQLQAPMQPVKDDPFNRRGFVQDVAPSAAPTNETGPMSQSERAAKMRERFAASAQKEKILENTPAKAIAKQLPGYMVDTTTHWLSNKNIILGLLPKPGTPDEAKYAIVIAHGKSTIDAYLKLLPSFNEEQKKLVSNFSTEEMLCLWLDSYKSVSTGYKTYKNNAMMRYMRMAIFGESLDPSVYGPTVERVRYLSSMIATMTDSISRAGGSAVSTKHVADMAKSIFGHYVFQQAKREDLDFDGVQIGDKVRRGILESEKFHTYNQVLQSWGDAKHSLMQELCNDYQACGVRILNEMWPEISVMMSIEYLDVTSSPRPQLPVGNVLPAIVSEQQLYPIFKMISLQDIQAKFPAHLAHLALPVPNPAIYYPQGIVQQPPTFRPIPHQLMEQQNTSKQTAIFSTAETAQPVQRLVNNPMQPPTHNAFIPQYQHSPVYEGSWKEQSAPASAPDSYDPKMDEKIFVDMMEELKTQHKQDKKNAATIQPFLNRTDPNVNRDYSRLEPKQALEQHMMDLVSRIGAKVKGVCIGDMLDLYYEACDKYGTPDRSDWTRVYYESLDKIREAIAKRDWRYIIDGNIEINRALSNMIFTRVDAITGVPLTLEDLNFVRMLDRIPPLESLNHYDHNSPSPAEIKSRNMKTVSIAIKEENEEVGNFAHLVKPLRAPTLQEEIDSLNAKSSSAVAITQSSIPASSATQTQNVKTVEPEVKTAYKVVDEQAWFSANEGVVALPMVIESEQEIEFHQYENGEVLYCVKQLSAQKRKEKIEDLVRIARNNAIIITKDEVKDGLQESPDFNMTFVESINFLDLLDDNDVEAGGTYSKILYGTSGDYAKSNVSISTMLLEDDDEDENTIVHASCGTVIYNTVSKAGDKSYVHVLDTVLKCKTFEQLGEILSTHMDKEKANIDSIKASNMANAAATEAINSFLANELSLNTQIKSARHECAGLIKVVRGAHGDYAADRLVAEQSSIISKLFTVASELQIKDAVYNSSALTIETDRLMGIVISSTYAGINKTQAQLNLMSVGSEKAVVVTDNFLNQAINFIYESHDDINRWTGRLNILSKDGATFVVYRQGFLDDKSKREGVVNLIRRASTI